MIPVAICFQNSRSISLRSDGAPGERIAPRPVNFCIHPAGRPINTSIKVLRRPIEFAQYTADRFVACLAENRIVQSMSRRGNCWDNAVVERYFRTLKHDWMPENGYQNHFEAEKDVMGFISHYNHRRCHSASNHLPPAL
ncbi:hypothetical protein EI969_18455, partial [Pseudomonas sp. PB101]|nr:hypothetical protein [Pseudomonas sp. PB101]